MNMAEILAPIELKLYGSDDEVKATYHRSKIPWGLLKKAVRLANLNLNPDSLSEEDVDAIAGLVVEVFGDQFTIEDLDAGADLNEMLAVVQAIVKRASSLVKANPIPPQPRKK
jgi:hypothetical protein